MSVTDALTWYVVGLMAAICAAYLLGQWPPAARVTEAIWAPFRRFGHATIGRLPWFRK